MVLMELLARPLTTDSEWFQHIVLVLPDLLFEIKAGVFSGPQIQALVRDQNFVRKMNDKERGHGFDL